MMVQSISFGMVVTSHGRIQMAEMIQWNVWILLPCQALMVFVWQMLMGHHLRRKLPVGIRPRGILFYLLMIVEVCGFTAWIMGIRIWYGNIPEEVLWMQAHFGWFLMVWMAWLIVILVRNGFISWALKANELGRSPKVSEWILYFLMLWILPLGIWIVHHRARKIALADRLQPS
jgi:hypothetical protein